MKKKTQKNIVALTEGAMILALAYVLELLCVWLNAVTGISAFLLAGGTITVSMLPIVYYSYRRGAVWGIGAGFAYSLLQMALGFYVPPANTWWAIVLCILLDYVIAFSILGSADLFAKPFGKRRLLGYCVGGVAVCLIRLASSFLSGVILWGSYAIEGMNVWVYSLAYNSLYMIPNAIITGTLAIILCKAVDPKTLRPMKSEN